MTKSDYEIAAKLKARLSTVVRIVDFRVFGSRARGEAGEYSDMDVFIEVERLDKEMEDRIRYIAWEVGFEHLLHISPLVFSRHEIEEPPIRSSFIVQNIVEEGVKV
jgi:predicted nucleotidyltransferase